MTTLATSRSPAVVRMVHRAQPTRRLAVAIEVTALADDSVRARRTAFFDALFAVCTATDGAQGTVSDAASAA